MVETIFVGACITDCCCCERVEQDVLRDANALRLSRLGEGVN